MAKNSFSSPCLIHPIRPTIPISSTQFRCFFSKKSATPHPPYPVEPVFCTKISSNKLNINGLHFNHVYQSVTANRPFCPLFGPKKRSFRLKYSLFSLLFATASIDFANTQTLFQSLEGAPSLPREGSCGKGGIADADLIRIL
ncbi:MAG: hypothetical protein ABR907_10455 [Terracidiphilus sp.]|jgi:hypothetical protein